ncbi:hypothetical protein LEMLEM_LOCUS6875 [Lemmus lemmus]
MKLAVACCWDQPRGRKKKRSGHTRGRGLVLVAMDILAHCAAGSSSFSGREEQELISHPSSLQYMKTVPLCW